MKTRTMKVKLTTLMLAAAALLASCSQDDGLQQNTVNTEGLVPVTLSASIDNGLQTRAVSATEDETATRAYLEILVQDDQGAWGKATGDLVGVHTMVENGSSFTLSGIYLDPAEDYRFLFWADGATIAAAAPTDLENVDYTDGKIAFAACVDWGTEKSNTVSATLKHVVSKVTLKTTTDIDDSKPVYVEIPATYTAYDVNGGKVTGTTATKRFEITTPAEITGTPEGTEVFSFYTLVDEGTQELTVYHDGYELQVANVPLAPNKHTVLVGDVRYIGWEETTFTASIDAGWGREETMPIKDYVVENGTYIVSTAAGLQAWAEAAQNTPGTNCTLAADIDMTGVNWTPICADITKEYKGTFDGAGHTISNLNIDSSKEKVSFIGNLTYGGMVKNLIITNANIKSNNNRASYAGGIVGYCGSGTIQGCGFSGTVSAKTGFNNSYAGGIVGGAFTNSTITACWSTATEVTAAGDYFKYAGGIAGGVYLSSVTACYYTNVTEGLGYTSDNPTVKDVLSVGDGVTWETAMGTMNAALTGKKSEYQWIANTDEATKDDVPLVLKYAN